MARTRNDDVKIERTVKVPLTKTDIANHGSRMALLEQQHEAKELGKKAAAAHYKDDIDAIVMERRQLATEYRQGFRYDEVDCAIEYDTEKKKVYIVRLDTGEEISVRDMTADERQQRLPV